jgi:hypothetical protein
VTAARERELRAMVERLAARLAVADVALRRIRAGLAAAGAPNAPIPRPEGAELLRLARQALEQIDGVEEWAG